MTEEKTRMKKFIQDGVIRYARAPLSLEDELQEKELEIKNLKSLVDSLRSRIENLEQEQQRQTLLDKPVGSIDSYGCYS
jgi:chromosome segregation ATPase